MGLVLKKRINKIIDNEFIYWIIYCNCIDINFIYCVKVYENGCIYI